MIKKYQIQFCDVETGGGQWADRTGATFPCMDYEWTEPRRKALAELKFLRELWEGKFVFRLVFIEMTVCEWG